MKTGNAARLNESHNVKNWVDGRELYEEHLDENYAHRALESVNC